GGMNGGAGGRPRFASRAGCNTGPATANGLDAQREQCYRADTHDQDHQGDRVVIEPMSTLYIHDAPRPESRIHSCPLPIAGGRWLASPLVAGEGPKVQNLGAAANELRTAAAALLTI